MDRLLKFWRLPGSDQILLAQAALRLSAVSLGVRLLPFAFWRSRLENHQTASPGSLGGASPDRILWAVTVAAGYVPGANCLVRSLVARSMLWREGHCAELRLGVSAGLKRPFQGHAWLESRGRVVLGGGESSSQYKPLATEASRGPTLAS